MKSKWVFFIPKSPIFDEIYWREVSSLSDHILHLVHYTTCMWSNLKNNHRFEFLAFKIVYVDILHTYIAITLDVICDEKKWLFRPFWFVDYAKTYRVLFFWDHKNSCPGTILQCSSVKIQSSKNVYGHIGQVQD